MAVVAILAMITFLFGGVIGALVVIVAGIRRDDCARSLTATPRTPIEGITRRVLGVSVRNEKPGHKCGKD
jgi:hypothetical protein